MLSVEQLRGALEREIQRLKNTIVNKEEEIAILKDHIIELQDRLEKYE